MNLVEKTRSKFIYRSFSKPVSLFLDDIGYVYSILDHDGDVFYNEHRIVDFRNINENVISEKFDSFTIERENFFLNISNYDITIVGKRKDEYLIKKIINFLIKKQKEKRLSENVYLYSLAILTVVASLGVILKISDKLIGFSVISAILLMTITVVSEVFSKFENKVLLLKKSQRNFLMRHKFEIILTVASIFVAGVLNELGLYKIMTNLVMKYFLS